jgi:hypothetical protein
MENEYKEEEYNPKTPNVYKYRAEQILETEVRKNILTYEKIFVSCYEIQNTGKFPFIQYLLTKSPLDNSIYFPELDIPRNFNSNELINFSKMNIFGLINVLGLVENDLEISADFFYNNVDFKGFYEYKNNLYIFFDISKYNITKNYFFTTQDCVWLVLIDEIVNYKATLHLKIEESVSDLFIMNDLLCFLCDDNDKNYEIPNVGYVLEDKKRLNFLYNFGQSKNDDILGSCYYFVDFDTILRNIIQEKGIVRFALFMGITKYFENNPNDDHDISEIKQKRLEDPRLNQQNEQLTMRVTDYDSKWKLYYDSAYLGNIELDNGNLLERKLIALKEYEQQVSLSYHVMSQIITNN